MQGKAAYVRDLGRSKIDVAQPVSVAREGTTQVAVFINAKKKKRICILHVQEKEKKVHNMKAAGNPKAKNWHDEAQHIVEEMVRDKSIQSNYVLTNYVLTPAARWNCTGPIALQSGKTCLNPQNLETKWALKR